MPEAAHQSTEPVNTGREPCEEHVVVFSLGGQQFALSIDCVQEIVRLQGITVIPGSDAWLEGITNLRGRVTPVIDLGKRCGLPAGTRTADSRIIVVSGGRGVVGLVVDSVSEVIRIPVEQIEAPGAILREQENQYLRGIAKLEDRLISLMDLDGVFGGGAIEAFERSADAA